MEKVPRLWVVGTGKVICKKCGLGKDPKLRVKMFVAKNAYQGLQV